MADISIHEQLSICIRYIYEDKIREYFLQFVPVHDVTGKGLATAILTSLEKIGVKTKYLRGQGYDDASAISGKLIGAQACVQKKHPSAMYVHCASHSLNLAISSSCSVAEIRNCCGTATKLYSFFNTAKRSEILKQVIQKRFPEAKAKRLKQLCPTRWVERHDAIIFIDEMVPAIHDALDEISTWEDAETSSSAVQLKYVIESSFIISLKVLAKAFSVSLPLCRALQFENVDLLATINMVNKLKGVIQALRTDAETEFIGIYDSSVIMAESFSLNITVPRISCMQTQRCNVQADSREEYFRITILLPFLDNFLSQLNIRFLKHQDVLGSFMCLMPSEGSSITNVEEEHLQKLIKFYEDDVECSDVAAIGELHLWYERIKDLKIS